MRRLSWGGYGPVTETRLIGNKITRVCKAGDNDLAPNGNAGLERHYILLNPAGFNVRSFFLARATHGCRRYNSHLIALLRQTLSALTIYGLP